MMDLDRTMLGSIIAGTAIYCPWCQNDLYSVQPIMESNEMTVAHNRRHLYSVYSFKCGLQLRIGKECNDVMVSCPDKAGRQFKEVKAAIKDQAKETKQC